MGDSTLLYVYAGLFLASAAFWLFADFFRSKKDDDSEGGLAERYTDNSAKRHAPIVVMAVSLFLFVEGGGLKLIFD